MPISAVLLGLLSFGWQKYFFYPWIFLGTIALGANKAASELIGADTQHYYKPIYSCDVVPEDYGYRLFSDALKNLSGCNPEYGLFLEACAFFLLSAFLFYKIEKNTYFTDKKQKKIATICLSVYAGVIFLNYFLSGSKQAFSLILILISSHYYFLNQRKYSRIFIMLAAASFHSIGVISVMYIVGRYLMKTVPTVVFMTACLVAAYFFYNFENIVTYNFLLSNQYTQKVISYSELYSQDKTEFDIINVLRIVVFTTFSLILFAFYKRSYPVHEAAIMFLLVTFMLTYLVLIGFFGYLTTTRVLLVAQAVFLLSIFYQKNIVFIFLATLLHMLLFVSGLYNFIAYSYAGQISFDQALLFVFPKSF